MVELGVESKSDQFDGHTLPTKLGLLPNTGG